MQLWEQHNQWLAGVIPYILKFFCVRLWPDSFGRYHFCNVVKVLRGEPGLGNNLDNKS